jgi:hypothetical protein
LHLFTNDDTMRTSSLLCLSLATAAPLATTAEVDVTSLGWITTGLEWASSSPSPFVESGTVVQWATYFADMIKLATAENYQGFFCGSDNSILHKDVCLALAGPGTDTTSFVTWEETARILSNGPSDIETGKIQDRGNELGLLRLNNIFWPECATHDPLSGAPIATGSAMGGSECGIGLGVDKASHAFFRPLLDSVFGTPAGETNSAGEASEDSRYTGHVGEFVQNGNGWTKHDLKQQAREWLASRDTFPSGELKQWVTQVLHLHAVGLTLTDEEAAEFNAFQSGVLAMSVLPKSLALAASPLLKIPEILAQKEAYTVRYMESLGETKIAEGWDENELRYAAGALLESFVFAGGLSVPSMIVSSLGSYYKWDLGGIPTGGSAGAAPIDPSTYPDSGKLIMESTRYNPPVVGWPSISEDENGVEHRSIGIVAMAGFDTSKYGRDADAFNVARFDNVTQWHQLSMNWADHGIHPDRDVAYANRVCPAKDLSYTMVAAFLEEMDPKTWTAGGTPEEASGPSWWGEFTLTRK